MAVAGSCAILATTIPGLSDPSECAPLSGTSASLLALALGAFLLSAATLGVWMARLAVRRAPVGWPLFGELGSIGIAIFLWAWLAGGTSC